MEVRQTKIEEIPVVMEIIEAAKMSIKELGISQWQNGYPNVESIRADIAQGISYVLLEEGKIVATAAMSLLHEPTYQVMNGGEWLTGDEAHYVVIHRIAVKQTEKKKGYAGKLLDFSKELAKKDGAVSLRIDTHVGNLPMRGFLAKYGFTLCGDIYLTAEHNEDTRRLAYEYVL